MLEVLRARKEALKEQGNKGFTLMEMLIVIAIIAVLVAIAIPIFASQLENSREATDKANLRSAYAEVVTAYLNDGNAHTVDVKAQQQDGSTWASGNATIGSDLQVTGVSGAGASAISVTPSAAGWTVAIDDKGAVTITAKSSS